MSAMSTLEVRDALAGIIGAMAADSYELELVGAEADRLDFSITAHEDACADCLAPLPIMAGVISSALGGRYRPDQIHIAYP